MEELVATFRQEVHRWDSTAILRCETPPNGKLSFDLDAGLTIKTTCEPDELVPSLSYRFYGRWTNYTNKRTHLTEKQFDAKTFIRCQPHGQAGVIRYLMQAPNVGQSIARKLWDKFGGDAVRILREQPDVAAAACGVSFTEVRAKEAAEWLDREKSLENCSIDLIDLLGGRGFPRDTHKKLRADHGNRAAEVVRRNPHGMMKYPGCGFLRTDAMYLDLGGDPARLKRQALCAWYTLARDTEGNTWHDKDFVVAGLKKMIGGTAVQPVPAVTLAKRAKLICTRRSGMLGQGREKLWLAEGKKARHEREVAERICAALTEKPQWPAVADESLSPHQREQLLRATSGMIGVLCGSPGTGKTYTAARLIAMLIRLYGEEAIAVAAPTGKAAVRITELMAGYGVAIKARTIHSLLGVASKSEGDGWGFEHGENNPLPYRFVIIDESSMIDTDLMAALFRARAVGTHFLFIGDVNQLPPVGHGAPLRDFIAAGVPTGELREIRRNAGAIVHACAAIRDGKSWRTCERLLPADGENLKLVHANSNDDAAKKIIDTLKAIRDKGLADPIWDCQVIVAVNEKSALSRKLLNAALRVELNTTGRFIGPFWPGDKIVCLKNGFLPLAEKGLTSEFDAPTDEGDQKVFVANGELGRVLEAADNMTIAEFDAPNRVVKIPRGKATADGDDADGEKAATGCNFDLGYAISCHKSQGSEWPIVIVALDEYPGARWVCDRSWVYTAISRAKRACILVGKKATADGFCGRASISKRKTFLRELIEEGRKAGREEAQEAQEGGAA